MWCFDHAVVEADISDGVLVAFGCRDEEQGDAWGRSAVATARTTRDELAPWQPILVGPEGPASIKARR